LRLGVDAEPFLVSPNQSEAEGLVGQEFHDDEDFLLALDRIAEMGARNVLITTENGCVALLREEREAQRYRAISPRLDPVSTVGSGDALLGAFLAARHAGRSHEESPRAAVATGAAATLEGGIGIVHRNLSIAAQVEEVDKVKRSESGMIVEAVTLPPDALVADALALIERYHISGVPITDDEGRLVGILTNRDLRFQRDVSLP